jgi:HSP20 family protein
MARSSENSGRQRDERAPPHGILGAFEDPVSTLRRVSDQVERLFHEIVGARPRSPRAQDEGPDGWMPQVEVSQRGAELVIGIDLPGVSREDIEIEVEDGRVVIRGERRQAAQRSEGGVLRSECSYGRFYRAVPLPEGANREAARAAMRDGVLEITLPVPPRKQPRRLEIEDEDAAPRGEAYRTRESPAATSGAEQDRRQSERRDWQGEGRLGM